MSVTQPHARHRVRLPRVCQLPLLLALGLVLAGCGNDAPPPAAQDAAPADATEQAPAPADSGSAMQALGTDELRQSARVAYNENRLYAPAGDNAVEYFLALRERPEGEVAASSGLIDLLPLTVIAAEQSVSREDFEEAARLVALLERAEPTHPALNRLRESISARRQAAAERLEQEQVTAEEQARRQAEIERERDAEQQRQQEQAAAALARRQAVEAEEAEEAEQAEQQRLAQQAAAERAEREAAERRAAEEAERRAAAAARPTAADLRPVSMPSPQFPRDALRTGRAGEVQVEFTVGTDGAVSAARVVRAEPARVFDRAALEAVERWRFQPLTAPVTTRRTIAFDPGS